MAKIKLNIEVDETVYQDLKKRYDEMVKELDSEIYKSLKDKVNFNNFDEFLTYILTSFSKAPEQMKQMSSKIKDLMEKLGGISGMDLGDMDYESFFGDKPKKETKKEEKKPTTTNTNLKN